jgi:hypothetical protein
MQGKLNSILFIFSMILLIPISTVLASSNSRDDLGAFATGSKSDRPPINSDFAPDESCWFDVNQLKCVPGSQQECPEGFEINEDRQCHPTGDCPEDYMTIDDDESGQCYPSSEADCNNDNYLIKSSSGERFDYVFIEDKNGEEDYCANPAYLCDDESSHEICKEYLDSE